MDGCGGVSLQNETLADQECTIPVHGERNCSSSFCTAMTRLSDSSNPFRSPVSASLLAVVLIFAAVGCHSHDHEGEAFNAQSAALHDSLMVIEADVRAELNRLEATLGEDSDGSALADSIAAIDAAFADWAEYLVEPLGDDHDHDHGHDHDHSHEPAPDVTPEQMVDLQQALLDGIVAIQARVSSLGQEVSSDEAAE